MDISPSSTQIVTGDQLKKMRIFDLARPDADPRFLTAAGSDSAHEKTVKSVVWLPDGRQIVSGGEDGVIRLAAQFSYLVFFLHYSHFHVVGGIYAPTILFIR